ncbi:hypothetical protein GOBAR_AA04314 [Gossypium barbadense]|uniref:SBP-type domain-containing protein n=1 Tax=Gossypium barbadense TaxID=3634 RepID=A0A2P5YKY7_GOSBA|nr:hypothetical protein GOBAR_AA04314 [Gossypium barbadense]
MESAPSSASFKRARPPGFGNQVPSCLVDGCTADLSKCRDYHRRHKVCEVHSKTPKVSIRGQEQRFCQQCSRFHSLVEFDEGKRSCRKRLDGHNRRRRKPQPNALTVNSGSLLSNPPMEGEQVGTILATDQNTNTDLHGNGVFRTGHPGSSASGTHHTLTFSWETMEEATLDFFLYFSHCNSSRYLLFSGPQIFSTKSMTDSSTGAVKVKIDRSSSLNFSSRNSSFVGASSLNYKGERQFSFLQSANSSHPGVSVCQPLVNANPSPGNGGITQKMLLNGLNRTVESNRALSLLSSQPAETREISLSPMVQSGSTSSLI